MHFFLENGYKKRQHRSAYVIKNHNIEINRFTEYVAQY